MSELVLPDFQMDCRDWVVLSLDDAVLDFLGLGEEAAAMPLLAVLSTAIIGRHELYPVRATLSVGLLDGATLATRPFAVGCMAAEVIEEDFTDSGSVSYVLPTPDGDLALMAEFYIDTDDVEAMDLSDWAELRVRAENLMISFQWAVSSPNAATPASA